jgi:hypothetical protein
MLKIQPLTLSERCRALAEECRAKARSFRNEKPRTKMFQLAPDYERKAKRAESLEVSLRRPQNQDTSLIPEISEAFVKQSED